MATQRNNEACLLVTCVVLDMSHSSIHMCSLFSFIFLVSIQVFYPCVNILCFLLKLSASLPPDVRLCLLPCLAQGGKLDEVKSLKYKPGLLSLAVFWHDQIPGSGVQLQKIDNSYFVFSGIMISNSLLSASKRKAPIKKKEKKGRNIETERVKHKIAFKAFSYISGCLSGHISAVLGVHDLASETPIQFNLN